MTYAKLMIQAYAEARGITMEEALKLFGVADRLPADKKSVDRISDRKEQEILDDLRKDPQGVLGWRKETTA
jgi:hypothetical protein